jgi:hypothetical protein
MTEGEEAENPYWAWSGRKDLNLRPLAPHASTLPDCATPRLDWHNSLSL